MAGGFGLGVFVGFVVTVIISVMYLALDTSWADYWVA
jgi:hypothetical protein